MMDTFTSEEQFTLECATAHLPGVPFTFGEFGDLQLEGASIQVDDLFTYLSGDALHAGVCARSEYLCDLVRLRKLQPVTRTLSPELDVLLHEERQMLRQRVDGFRAGSIFFPNRLAQAVDPAGLLLYHLRGEHGDYRVFARYDDETGWFTLEEYVALPGLHTDKAGLTRRFPDCRIVCTDDGVRLHATMCAPTSGMVSAWLKACRSGLRRLAGCGIPELVQAA